MLFVVALMTVQLQQQSSFFTKADGDDGVNESVDSASDEPVVEQIALSGRFEENTEVLNALGSDSSIAAQASQPEVDFVGAEKVSDENSIIVQENSPLAVGTFPQSITNTTKVSIFRFLNFFDFQLRQW